MRAGVGMWALSLAVAAELVPVRLHEEVRVDGVLDEAVWQGPPIQGFVQWDPDPEEPDPYGTRAWIAYDDKTLFVAFDARTSPDRRLSTALSPRDRNRGEDTVAVLLDTFRDGLRAYLFMVNGRGVQGDAIFVEGETALVFPRDMSWDGVWEAAGTFEAGRYVVELAIPLRSLRFPKGRVQTWNLVLAQQIAVPMSVQTWPPLDPDVAGVVRQAATLGPFELAVRPSRLELLPTLTGFADLATGDVTVDPGVAARIGITTSLTGELAVNPDFSQIESDTAQIAANVKFPLFYPERRPFFLENVDLLTTPLTLVNTRSVVDPLTITKASGRLGELGAIWLGGFDQRPARSTISVDYSTGESLPTWSEDDTEDADAVVALARLRGDLGGGSSVGWLLSEKVLLGSAGALSNQVGAMDAKLVSGRYTATGQLATSMTTFPDGSAATATAWDASLFRAGQGWVWFLGHGRVAPGFRAENGFLLEVGRTRGSAWTMFPARPGGVFRYVAPGVEANASWNPDGEVATANVGPVLSMQLGQRWSVDVEGGYAREQYFGRGFDLAYSGAEVSARVMPAWVLGVEGRYESLPHYAFADPADLYRGNHVFVGPFTNADVFGRMNVGVTVGIDRFGPSVTGEPEYLTAVARGTALLALTPAAFARVIEQYDSFAGELQSSWLLGYIVNYGTTAYLGYNEVLPREGEAVRTAFAKIGILARP